MIELDCEVARFSMPTRHPDAKLIDVTPYPELLDGDSATFGMTCPYTEIDGSIFKNCRSAARLCSATRRTDAGWAAARSRTP